MRKPKEQLHLASLTRRYGAAPKQNAPRPLAAAGLFSGIGGVELGLSKAGVTSNLLCEVEPAARAVLDARFPDVPKHGDIRTLRALPRGTRLVAAGFPCQDLSQAGRTRGIRGSRSGLVGEVFRLLEQQRVPWVVLENVPFMLQLARGEALEVIVSALEHHGYKWAYRVVDSRSFGLPQRRERVIFVATLDDADPRDVLLADDVGEPLETRNFPEVACGFYWTEGIRGLGWAVDAIPTLKVGSTIGIASPPSIIFPNGELGIPDIRDAERMQGFPANWTEPALRVMRKGFRWKLVGNAVTVNVFEWLGQRLLSPGHFNEPIGAQPILAGKSWPSVGWNIGYGRMTSSVSAWPVRTSRKPLVDFLEHDVSPLSIKATKGFLSRCHRSRLHFPKGFLSAVAAHLVRMERGLAAA